MMKAYKTEITISYVLRWGVIVCALVIGFGFFGQMTSSTGGASSSALIAQLTSGQEVGDQTTLRSVSELTVGIRALDFNMIMMAGLILLIALPIMRVALTTFIFFFERDWAFFAITLVVFSVLMTGLIWGKGL